jgi:class 3 adenylate cyclase
MSWARRMRCSKCAAENREGRQFCADCGVPLNARCALCGAENDPAEKFCGECGVALAGKVQAVSAKAPATNLTTPEIHVTPGQPDISTAVDGERKTVTALFADIKGSTELMRDLDPEEARAIVDPVLHLMMEAVHRYGGYVAQSTGDGIFALFGAPVAHEDHPQRALHAALAMQEELCRYADRLRADGKIAVEARVGVNTGEVVVRTIETGGHTEYTPVGHVTNLAARMQTLAPAGSIAASAATQRLCEGYFEFRTLGPTAVKGLNAPVEVYEVVRAGPLRTHFQLSARRGLTRFVGRESELEQMRRTLKLAMSGRGQVVAMVGEAGTGKSRLVYEFKAALPAECKLLEAYSVLHGKASAWLPVLELLHNYFDIQDANEPTTRREKVRAALAALDPTLSDVLPYLLGLLGIQEDPDPLALMDPQIRRRRTLEAIKRIILRESLEHVLVVIFEDLHWIDSETQALLDLLVDSIAGARLLLLVNYRPEYRHDWSGGGHYLQFRLDPLGNENAAAMLAALLGDASELEAPKRLIAQRTGGNPFFIEEMVQALFEQGILRRNGAVKMVRPLSQAHVPVTLQGLLASRIDRLSAQEKELLQTLAVIGNEFPLALAKRVTQKRDEELQRELTNLRLGEFIYEQPALADVEYAFKHALTQEVAYNSVLVEPRRMLHERTGEGIEELFSGQLDDHLAELAHHFSHSSNVEKAVDYLDRAGAQALQR